MKKESSCYEYEASKSTGGEPVMTRVCYCGTTACKEPLTNQYPSPDYCKEPEEFTPQQWEEYYKSVDLA